MTLGGSLGAQGYHTVLTQYVVQRRLSVAQMGQRMVPSL